MIHPRTRVGWICTGLIVVAVCVIGLVGGELSRRTPVVPEGSRPEVAVTPDVNPARPSTSHVPALLSASVHEEASVHGAPDARQRPLPPPDTPWSELYDALMERAMMGDKVAAERLFHDSIRCQRYMLAAESARMTLKDTGTTVDLSERRLDASTTVLDRVSAMLKADATLCDDVDIKQLGAAIYPILLSAAKLGSPTASVCYVAASYRPGTAQQEDAAQEASYRENALELAQREIDQGNWKMVSLMAQAYADDLPGYGWFNMLVAPDPLKVYAYTKLMSFGATEDDVASVHDQLQLLLTHNSFRAGEIEAAEAWARQVYATSFRDKPMQLDGPLCADSSAAFAVQ